jgi:hypothetical protein
LYSFGSDMCGVSQIKNPKSSSTLASM